MSLPVWLRSLPGAGLLMASALAPATADDLSSQLSNPVASLISVPLQYNYNSGFLNGTAEQSYINVQPVIPISIGDNWNLISRTIIPVVSQSDFTPGTTQNGFGNTVQSLFFSPKEPTRGGLIWGAGPVIQIPTNTDGLGRDQWGLGLTGVALKQSNGWTYGGLANHIWSVSNDDVYGHSSVSFLQPFVSYSTPGGTTYSGNIEASYDWEGDEWAVPVNFVISQLVTIANRPVQIGGGVRYWADAPQGGPDGWGARLVVTYLFPKK